MSEKSGQLKPRNVDLDKLAYAVAMAETKNCTSGRIGTQLNNCHGIRNGGTAPCSDYLGIDRNSGMCIFGSSEQSYEAFKKIWSKWYVGFPTYQQAVVWTGGDNPQGWLNSVVYYYNQS